MVRIPRWVIFARRRETAPTKILKFLYTKLSLQRKYASIPLAIELLHLNVYARRRETAPTKILNSGLKTANHRKESAEMIHRNITGKMGFGLGW